VSAPAYVLARIRGRPVQPGVVQDPLVNFEFLLSIAQRAKKEKWLVSQRIV
jgi:hypothetical protein